MTKNIKEITTEQDENTTEFDTCFGLSNDDDVEYEDNVKKVKKTQEVK